MKPYYQDEWVTIYHEIATKRCSQGVFDLSTVDRRNDEVI